MARCCPALTGRRPANCRIGTSVFGSDGMVTVGPVPAEPASALLVSLGLGRLMSATRKVTVPGLLPSPNARMRNLVITPSTGAPLELGSPFGSTGWVKSTSVQLGDGSVGNITHDPVVGSFLRRLPNVVAALPAGASRSSAPP